MPERSPTRPDPSPPSAEPAGPGAGEPAATGCCGALRAPRARPGGRGGAAGAGRASPRSPRCAPTEVDDTYAGLREQDLIDVLNGLAGTTQRAQAEIDRLERDPRRPAVRRPAAARPRSSQAQTEADTLASWPAWCRSPARASGSRSPRSTARSSVDSMLDMVQELRTAGAEAIQVNGEVRVVAQTRSRTPTAASWSTARSLESPYVDRRDRRARRCSPARSTFPTGRASSSSDDGGDGRGPASSPRSTSRPSSRPAQPEFAEPDPGQ